MKSSYPTSIRWDAETKQLIERLAKALGITEVSVLRMAVRLLAKREGIRHDDP